MAKVSYSSAGRLFNLMFPLAVEGGMAGKKVRKGGGNIYVP